jgi:DNA-binding CsgD family transcriptional regulator
MITPSSIAQQTVRILSYLDKETIPTPPPESDHTLQALYNMHKLFPGCVVITCPAQHGKFFYISDNCENIFGYNAAYMSARFRDLADYITRIHEADLDDYKECISFLESYMKTLAPEDFFKIRIVLHYRFLIAGGQYRYLHDEKASLINADGIPVHYSLIRAIPSGTVFGGVKLELFRQNAVLEKILEHKPSSAKKLSSRENELVGLIKQGLTTKEIAWQLSISHNTVRNIKSKLFEKFNVNNTIELLNMTA